MLYQLVKGRTRDDFLRGVASGRMVYALEPTENGQYGLVRSDQWKSGQHVLGDYRPVEPLKSLVFRPRESLGPVFQDMPRGALPERIVIGVKNCDLSALQIHDFVFLKMEPVDPAYAELREKTVLISCDCAGYRDACFCPAVGEQPYAKTGFDINLSPLPNGTVIETGSEKGERLAQAAKDFLEPAGKETIEARDKARAEMYRRVAENAAKKGLRPGMDYKKAIGKSFDSDLWDDFAKDCVECGACNFVCCTCHCFLLADGIAGNKLPGREKLWDSCLFRNFARVAGGGNPRKHRAERLLNRFDKKFNFFPTVLGIYACDGCGRCVEACTGKIDIRDVLKRAMDES